MASTFNSLKTFFVEICNFDVLCADKLAQMCVKDENEHALYPRAERARSRASMIQRLHAAVRAWCRSELVYAYLFSGDKSVRDCWECMKDLREIALGTAKAETLHYRNQLDLRYFPSVEVHDRIEYQSIDDADCLVNNGGRLNIAEYLFDYCVLVDERLLESRRVLGVFNEQLALFENAVFGKSLVADTLQSSFDIDLGQFVNGNKKRFEVSPERFRAFLSMLRPYSRQLRMALEKKLYLFSDCLNYMDYLRIGCNLSENEECLRRELMSVIDGHDGVAVLDRLANQLSVEIAATVDGDEGMLIACIEAAGEHTELDAMLRRNTQEAADMAAFLGLNEKSAEVDGFVAPTTKKKRGRPKKPRLSDVNPQPAAKSKALALESDDTESMFGVDAGAELTAKWQAEAEVEAAAKAAARAATDGPAKPKVRRVQL